jgi:hypothetical protein
VRGAYGKSLAAHWLPFGRIVVRYAYGLAWVSQQADLAQLLGLCVLYKVKDAVTLQKRATGFFSL